MTKRMIALRRVSTDDQADKGYSLPSQFESIKRYAAQLGYTIVADFADDCSGTIPLGDRPEGAKALAMLRRKDADGIIVHHVDRLSRDLVDALTIVRDLTRNGLEVHATNIGRIAAETDIVLVIQAWQAGDERKKIIERTTRGRNQKAQQGKVVGTGKPPYGYQHGQDGTLVIDPAPAEHVKQIFRWYTYERIGALAIAERLTESGILPPFHTRTKSPLWSQHTVLNILANETYAGTWHYRKHDHRRMTDKSNWIPVAVPAIVDRVEWIAAQFQRADNIKFSRRNSKRDYLLRGMIVCDCGRRMCGSISKSATAKWSCLYYLCPRATTTLDKTTCRRAKIRADVIESKVWRWIVSLIKNPDYLSERLNEARGVALAASEPQRIELAHVTAMIEQVDTELGETLALMKGLPQDSLRYKKLDQESLEIEARHGQLTARAAKLESEIAAQLAGLEAITDALQFNCDALEGLDDPTRLQMRRWLELLGTTIQVQPGESKALVTVNLPIEGHLIDFSISQ